MERNPSVNDLYTIVKLARYLYPNYSI